MKIKKSILITLLLCVSMIQTTYSQDSFTGTWVGVLENQSGHLWNVKLHVGIPDGETAQVARISFPDWGMFRLATSDLKISGKKIEFRVLWLDAHFKASLKKGVLEIDWSEWRDARGSMHRINENPDLFMRESVDLKTDDGHTIKGTIVFPNSPKPYNGMVMTHGSGPDTRITGAYISKAHLAVENGLAVLIYDKRGAGESSGSGFNNLDRLTNDALGMVEIMKNHPFINRDGVGIGGASQGGWIAPKAAYIDTTIAFVFTVATPGISPAEQNVYSLESRIVEKNKRVFAKEALRTLYEFYRTNNPNVRSKAVAMISNERFNLKEDRLFQRFIFSSENQIPDSVDPGFWADAMFEDPIIWWREIKVPVASFSGSEDINVPVVLSNKIIEAALQNAGNTNYELNIYPNSGHGLTLENLPKEDWPRMAYGYVDMMRAWFKKIEKL